jgi:outer membrane autotransporter protein
MNYLITINNGTVKPFINLEYSADLSNGSDATMQYNAGSTSYALNLDKTATNSWKLGLGADIYTKDEWNSSISYERTEAINAGYSDSLAVKVRLKF